MTTKQRAYLKGLAMTMEPIFQIGKNRMTPELTKAIQEALDARELIKVSVLKNCADDPRCPGGASGRAYPCPGGTGDREKDCAV